MASSLVSSCVLILLDQSVVPAAGIGSIDAIYEQCPTPFSGQIEAIQIICHGPNAAGRRIFPFDAGAFFPKLGAESLVFAAFQPVAYRAARRFRNSCCGDNSCHFSDSLRQASRFFPPYAAMDILPADSPNWTIGRSKKNLTSLLDKRMVGQG
jgi:hypothetical protein